MPIYLVSKVTEVPLGTTYRVLGDHPMLGGKTAVETKDDVTLTPIGDLAPIVGDTADCIAEWVTAKAEDVVESDYDRGAREAVEAIYALAEIAPVEAKTLDIVRVAPVKAIEAVKVDPVKWRADAADLGLGVERG